MERLDVRVPHAAADHADLSRHDLDGPASAWSGARSSTAASTRTPGASPSRGTARPTPNSIINIRAFGVPGLGFKRGLADDLVVAPYASAMALMVAPPSRPTTCGGSRARSASASATGAIDYTPARLRAAAASPSPSALAHHRGMAFLALACLLEDRPMRRRFFADPAFRATPTCCCKAGAPRARRLSAPRRGLGRWRPHLPRSKPARRHDPRYAGSAGTAAHQRHLPRHGHQRRWQQLQPLARPRGHALARGHHPRLLGQLLLPVRHRHRWLLVDGASAHASACASRLPGSLLAGASRVSPARPRHRDPRRDWCLGGG